jgi:hypothetical protein
MRTKYRYIEGYRGNDTVRLARFRQHLPCGVRRYAGNRRVSEGRLTRFRKGCPLRPAIPSEEIFSVDNTRSARNFQDIRARVASRRRFRVTVVAEIYCCLMPHQAAGKVERRGSGRGSENTEDGYHSEGGDLSGGFADGE